jgi:DNA-directed RNA polymerase specialized sigma24 family protein
MSPLSLRRYRAERLLRDEFEGLRERVLASVRGRLGASAASLDEGDLEACYAIAWQGLYAAVLEGREIANPAGWLVLVTFRRSVDELRAQGRAHRGGMGRAAESARRREGIDPAVDAVDAMGATERDLAAELDDRMRLRQVFEGLRGQLNGREREAATLCYLQGLSRSQAAASMGVSDARMRKLMEGRGPGRPGVAGKVGALVQAIRDGEWCEEQGSLMRALAYGMLDPQGERYQLALVHHGQCPACRAYVVSLRGLAAALPPVLLPWSLGAAALARAVEGGHLASGAGAAGGGAGGVSAGGAASNGAPGGAAGAGLQAGRGVAGAASASGAAGVGGAAGGGWLVGAGPFGAKLAVGCLLALGVGAGCVALDNGDRAPAHQPRHRPAHVGGRVIAIEPTADTQLEDLGAIGASSSATGLTAKPPLTPGTRAIREFGPEALVAGTGSSAASAAPNPAARSARVRSAASGAGDVGASTSGASSARAGSGSGGDEPIGSGSTSTGDSAAAEREFSPG